jgi:hypothetical protein
MYFFIMEYKRNIRELISAEDTGLEMARLSCKYKDDLGEMANWPLPKFFDYVKNLPYRKDPKNIESLSRPRFLLMQNWPWRDCDDKAILLGAWAASNYIPFRFLATAAKKNIPFHHVFIELEGKKNLLLDSTYSKNIFGTIPKFFKIKPLTPWIENMPQIQILEGSEMGFNPFKNTGRKVKNLARQTKNLGKKALKAITPPIPKNLQNSAKKVIKALLKNKKITAATKAAIIAPATAAVLAIPGMQIYAIAVPPLVNKILNEIIKSSKVSEPDKTPDKAPENLTIAEKKAAAIAKAKEKAGSLKVKKVKKGTEPAPGQIQDLETTKPNFKLIGAGIAATIGALFFLRKSKK